MNVSIIVPAFNAAGTLAETVASVVAQTVPFWEMVIIDDGSTDATGALADEFARQDARIRVVHQANGGEAAARNAGLLAARHEWILFLDADDYIAPRYLERMGDALTANPALDAVHCGWARVAADGTQLVDLIAEAFSHSYKDREPPLPFKHIGCLVPPDRNLDRLENVGNVESVSRNPVAIQHDFEMFFAGHLLDSKVFDASKTGHRISNFFGHSSQDLSIFSKDLHRDLSIDPRD